MWLHEVDFHLAASAFLTGSAFTLSVLAVILFTGRKK